MQPSAPPPHIDRSDRKKRRRRCGHDVTICACMLHNAQAVGRHHEYGLVLDFSRPVLGKPAKYHRLQSRFGFPTTAHFKFLTDKQTRVLVSRYDGVDFPAGDGDNQPSKRFLSAQCLALGFSCFVILLL